MFLKDPLEMAAIKKRKCQHFWNSVKKKKNVQKDFSRFFLPQNKKLKHLEVTFTIVHFYWLFHNSWVVLKFQFHFRFRFCFDCWCVRRGLGKKESKLNISFSFYRSVSAFFCVFSRLMNWLFSLTKWTPSLSSGSFRNKNVLRLYGHTPAINQRLVFTS